MATAEQVVVLFEDIATILEDIAINSNEFMTRCILPDLGILTRNPIWNIHECDGGIDRGAAIMALKNSDLLQAFIKELNNPTIL